MPTSECLYLIIAKCITNTHKLIENIRLVPGKIFYHDPENKSIKRQNAIPE